MFQAPDVGPPDSAGQGSIGEVAAFSKARAKARGAGEGAGLVQHQQLIVSGIPVHVALDGESERPGVLFLHGWPESWAALGRIMKALCSEFRVATLDLPGIGESTVPPSSNDKRTLAGYVRGVVQQLDLKDVTLVGHDVGGQIVYAFLRAFPDELRSAVIMNVAVPAIDPWPEVLRNPFIWHFAFHAIPDLPERLVTGREAEYFGYFYDAISAKPRAVAESARRVYTQAYSRPEALRTGFEWYRAFRQDERDSFGVTDDLPLLTTPEWPGGRAEGLKMLAVAGRIQDASGGFIDTARELILFFTLHRFRVRSQ